MPPIGWWLLKRLPKTASEWFLLQLTRDLYGQFAGVGVELDDDILEIMFEPDIQWIQPASFPDSTTYHGHAGVREELDTFKAIFSSFSTDVKRAEIDPVRERVFLTLRHQGRGLASGANADLDEFHLYHVRRGRLWKLEMFTDEQAAMEARRSP
jgi:ketosteroid isomerase-like protein